MMLSALAAALAVPVLASAAAAELPSSESDYQRRRHGAREGAARGRLGRMQKCHGAVFCMDIIRTEEL